MDKYFFILLCFCLLFCCSCSLSSYNSVGYTCSKTLHKKSVYDIWFSPYLGIDLYQKHNSFVQSYLTIGDSLILKSDHNLLIFTSKRNFPKHKLKQLTYDLIQTQMHTTKITLKDLSTYLEGYETTDNLVVVLDNVRPATDQLVSLFKGTEFEVIEWDTVSYEVEYLQNKYETQYKVFSLNNLQGSIIFGEKSFIKDRRPRKKHYTLKDFNTYR